MLRRMHLLPKRPVVLAPRGEFSQGALSLKGIKKRLYISLAKSLGLYSGIMWQASSEYEMGDILSIFGTKATKERVSVQIAPDLPPLPPQDSELLGGRPIKQVGSARIVFLSRIARMKNLDFAIESLMKVKGKVGFDIYGPIEDQSYWEECQNLIRLLPDNIQASYCGIVPPDRVPEIFPRYHLFLFPTRGENFGHVILEALNAGCPVLTSDQTPWNNLTAKKAGWNLPLSKPEQFRAALDELIFMDNRAFNEMSRRARDYGRSFSENPDLVRANRELFLKALGM
ncbi:MAG: glycosyltransferase [Firmicutes bacterium]|nr:glycosyltransferase [Bacillota bacterium]